MVDDDRADPIVKEQKIDLTKDFKLVYDRCGNKFLLKRKETKNGNVHFQNYNGYFPRFEMLFEDFLECRPGEKNVKTVEAALKSFTDTEKEILRMVKKAGAELDDKMKRLLELQAEMGSKRKRK